MWYVIQTVTGKEEELIDMMNTILERDLYRDCFIIRAEWMKRLGGQWQTQVRPLFPGYVFVDSEQPEELFFSLKRVPRFSRIIGNGRFVFTPVEESEKTFLETLMWGGLLAEKATKIVIWFVAASLTRQKMERYPEFMGRFVFLKIR